MNFSNLSSFYKPDCGQHIVMYDYVLFVIIIIHADVQDPYIVSHLLFVTSHCHSAVYVGGWVSCVHVYDKYGYR